MVAIPSRHKSLVLLAGVIVLQVLMLAVQIKRDSEGRLIRVWTVGAVSPFERAGSYGLSWVRDTWRHYFALRNATKENEQIRREKFRSSKAKPRKPTAWQFCSISGNRMRKSP
jgi:hypothetical protein